MYLLNGIRLSPNRGFTHNGVQYPANWIELSTEDDREAIGITYAAPSPSSYIDSRFYTLDENKKEVEKNLDELKVEWKAIQNKDAYNLLSSTDWYVIRKNEIDVDIPTEVSSYRSSVRSVCEQRNNALDSATNITEFIDATAFNGMNWPNRVL